MYPVTHIIVGTKAQFIKMAPIAYALEDRGWPYRILDLGQHGTITPGILVDFALNAEVVHIMPRGKTVSSYGHAALWTMLAMSKLGLSRKTLRDRYIQHPAGCALIHGDTLSTLLGLYFARRMGLRTGLVEAGLTSYRLFEPFPEELIRRHVENRVDMLFTPDDAGAMHLRRRGVRGVVVSTGYNTGRDALQLMAARSTGPLPEAPPTVMTLHRAETLASNSRLSRVIDHVISLSEHIGPIRFYLHHPTRRALQRARLFQRIESNPSFQIKPLASYPEFMRMLATCRFVLTDGGSIQEEAAYLGKPCLILRRTTERSDGIGLNAQLATMNVTTDLRFLLSTKTPGGRQDDASPQLSATNIILDTIYPLSTSDQPTPNGARVA